MGGFPVHWIKYNPPPGARHLCLLCIARSLGQRANPCFVKRPGPPQTCTHAHPRTPVEKALQSTRGFLLLTFNAGTKRDKQHATAPDYYTLLLCHTHRAIEGSAYFVTGGYLVKHRGWRSRWMR